MSTSAPDRTSGSSGAPWVEKYRPARIQDISHQETVKLTLNTIVKTHKMPHMLFFGPPGTGKTTAILALARELFGSGWQRRVRELNASDERGIKAVRENVKTFAEQLPATIPPKEDGSPIPNYKIIVLDEADMMTVDAQSCLRRIIEDYCQHTRFVLICNYISSIISPIQSRCATYRFEPVARPAQLERIRMIAARENFNISEEAVNQLIVRSEGDLRHAITTLYTLYCAGSSELSKAETVDDVVGFPSTEGIDTALRVMLGGQVLVSEMKSYVEDTIAEGWDLEALLKALKGRIQTNTSFSNVQKALISQVLASTQLHLSRGAPLYSALMALAVELRNVSTMKI